MVIQEIASSVWEIKTTADKVLRSFIEDTAKELDKMLTHMVGMEQSSGELISWSAFQKLYYRMSYSYLKGSQPISPHIKKNSKLYEPFKNVWVNFTPWDDKNNPARYNLGRSSVESPFSGVGDININIYHRLWISDMFYFLETSRDLISDYGRDRFIGAGIVGKESLISLVSDHKLNSVLAHEMQHAYDDYRSKGKAFYSKATVKYFNNKKLGTSDYDSYLNLSHEIWARFTETALSMDPTETDFRKWARSFQSNFLGWKLMNEKQKKRLIKELYKYFDWWQDLKKKAK